MSKKFFDIIPPKLSSAIQKKELSFSVSSKKRGKKVSSKTSKRTKKRPPRGPLSQGPAKGLLWGSVLVFLILGLVLWHFVLAKVEIEIWPKTETLTFKERVKVDTLADQPDFASKIIPGVIFEDEKSGSQEFPATGKSLKEERARGIIRVYNAYSTSPQGLLATTRFVSADGKLFRTKEYLVVPGAKMEKGKLVPSYIEAEVVAAKAGEDYNIEPSTFSIPGFAGTPKYTGFYGKSFSPMTGGFKGEVSIVLKEDLDKAKDVLVERLKKESRDSIREKVSNEFGLVEKTMSQEVVEAESLSKAGVEGESFYFKAKVKSRAIAFRKSDLGKFVKERIFSNMVEGKKILEESLEISWSSESRDLEDDKVLLDLEFSVKVYSDIEIAKLKRALAGKSIKETQVFLEDQTEINKIKIRVWPFWIKKLSQQEKKIKIHLRLD